VYLEGLFTAPGFIRSYLFPFLVSLLAQYALKHCQSPAPGASSSKDFRLFYLFFLFWDNLEDKVPPFLQHDFRPRTAVWLFFFLNFLLAVPFFGDTRFKYRLVVQTSVDYQRFSSLHWCFSVK